MQTIGTALLIRPTVRIVSRLHIPLATVARLGSPTREFCEQDGRVLRVGLRRSPRAQSRRRTWFLVALNLPSPSARLLPPRWALRVGPPAERDRTLALRVRALAVLPE